MKLVHWNAKAREYVRSLPPEMKIEIGALLLLLQRGQRLGEPQSKPLKAIDSKAHELRVKDRTGAHRIVYVLSLPDWILIPHAFSKKTQKTPPAEIRLAIKRLKELYDETE